MDPLLSSKLPILHPFVLALWAILLPTAYAEIIYVDAAATGNDDGTSWANAFEKLRIALPTAQPEDEIWVAAGTYAPAAPNGNRRNTFQLVSGVGVYGGFAGIETDREQRDPALNVTVLSGDLNSDDGPDFANNAENSYHVVNGSDTDAATVLDGFTITRGNANGAGSDGSGGGVYTVGGDVMLSYCTIQTNFAQDSGGGIYSEGSDVILTGCSVEGNVCPDTPGITGTGGGMTLGGGIPTISDCLFVGNQGGYGGGLHMGAGTVATLTRCAFVSNDASSGGGVNVTNCDPTFRDCTFVSNTTNYGGGAGLQILDASPYLLNCDFFGNVSDNSGGAVSISSGSDGPASPQFVQCLFSGNVAPSTAAAVLISSNDFPPSAPQFLHCSFSNNVAAYVSGGLYSVGIYPAEVSIKNCILWGNTAKGNADEEAQIKGGNVTVAYSCIQGLDDFSGSGNIGEDPMFTDPAGPDGIYGTEDDDLRLSIASPAVDAGSALDAAVDAVDLDGDGDYIELIPFDHDAIVRYIDDPCTPDTGASHPDYSDLGMIDMGAFESPGQTSGDDDFDGVLNCLDNCLEAYNPEQTDCDYDSIGDACETDRDRNGTPDSCEVPIRFVDAAALPGGDGLSWASAYIDLQDPLREALIPNSVVREIRVAMGTYQPAPPDGLRSESFNLVNGVILLGGYAGISGSNPDDRDYVKYESVLSGDLNSDDAPGEKLRQDNSNVVVRAENTDITTLLDGVTVTGGYAKGPFDYGGGALRIGTEAVLMMQNCRFVDNYATYGGGAVIVLSDANAWLTSCLFVGNDAEDGGAIQLIGDARATIVNCGFFGNKARVGGAIYHDYNCVNDSSVIRNSVFSGNTAAYSAGAAYFSNTRPSIENSTFVGNTAQTAGGIYLWETEINALIYVGNTILWGNTDSSGSSESAQLYIDLFATPYVDYSCIQGLKGDFGGVGNTGADPLLIDPDGQDNSIGTQDDNPRLSVDSPVIDAASNFFVGPDETDLDSDGDTSERIPIDLDGLPRFTDDPQTEDTGSGAPPIVDMGAYEFQPVLESCEGDANDDDVVDPLDSGFVLSRFGCPVGTGDSACDASDQNGDDVVDPLDVGFVLSRFGACP